MNDLVASLEASKSNSVLHKSSYSGKVKCYIE